MKLKKFLTDAKPQPQQKQPQQQQDAFQSPEQKSKRVSDINDEARLLDFGDASKEEL